MGIGGVCQTQILWSTKMGFLLIRTTMVSRWCRSSVTTIFLKCPPISHYSRKSRLWRMKVMAARSLPQYWQPLQLTAFCRTRWTGLTRPQTPNRRQVMNNTCQRHYILPFGRRAMVAGGRMTMGPRRLQLSICYTNATPTRRGQNERLIGLALNRHGHIHIRGNRLSNNSGSVTL
jgi:hypothetical protein